MATFQIGTSFIGNKIIHFCKVKISNFMYKQKKIIKVSKLVFF